MSETVMSEYIKGFDHGCDYIVAEIERYTKEASDPHASPDAMTRRIKTALLIDLIQRLKMEGKYDLGKVPKK
jgi:hypothetical protein